MTAIEPGGDPPVRRRRPPGTRPRALILALVWVLVAAADGSTRGPSEHGPALTLQVQPGTPTLIDEVVLEASILIEFGREVEFRLERVDPAFWGDEPPASPQLTTRWRDGGVEHVARWTLTPFLPGQAALPQVRAVVSAPVDAVAEGDPEGGFEVFDVVAGGGMVTIAPPPGAGGRVDSALADVVTDWPAVDRSWSRPATLATLAAALAAGLAAGWWLRRLQRRQEAAADDSPEAQLARVRAELQQLRLSGELPTRSRVTDWRRRLLKARRDEIPDGLLAQVDGLLYQSGKFDGRTARTWAADVAQWLDASTPPEK